MADRARIARLLNEALPPDHAQGATVALTVEIGQNRRMGRFDNNHGDGEQQ